jgi:hypothetical protein
MSCIWREDAGGLWSTECGHAFEFNDGGPNENQIKFCGYCGSSLKEEPFVDRPPGWEDGLSTEEGE